ncbi:unnamed protein product [Calypogeia fissa]
MAGATAWGTGDDSCGRGCMGMERRGGSAGVVLYCMRSDQIDAECSAAHHEASKIASPRRLGSLRRSSDSDEYFDSNNNQTTSPPPGTVQCAQRSACPDTTTTTARPPTNRPTE